MKTIFILLLSLSVTACTTASGPLYSDSHDPSIIVYRTDWPYRIRPYSVDVNGLHGCDLHANAFFILSPDRVNLTASLWDQPGTSKITVKGPAYVRIDYSQAKYWSGVAAGLIGELATEGINNGPYVFTIVAKEQALQELHGLHQDCL